MDAASVAANQAETVANQLWMINVLYVVILMLVVRAFIDGIMVLFGSRLHARLERLVSASEQANDSNQDMTAAIRDVLTMIKKEGQVTDAQKERVTRTLEKTEQAIDKIQHEVSADRVAEKLIEKVATAAAPPPESGSHKAATS
jgi:hypothetical protein